MVVWDTGIQIELPKQCTSFGVRDFARDINTVRHWLAIDTAADVVPTRHQKRNVLLPLANVDTFNATGPTATLATDLVVVLHVSLSLVIPHGNVASVRQPSADKHRLTGVRLLGDARDGFWQAVRTDLIRE
ncbi:hypothetical protein D3C79_850280 [compost metagenome]